MQGEEPSTPSPTGPSAAPAGLVRDAMVDVILDGAHGRLVAAARAARAGMLDPLADALDTVRAFVERERVSGRPVAPGVFVTSAALLGPAGMAQVRAASPPDDPRVVPVRA